MHTTTISLWIISTFVLIYLQFVSIHPSAQHKFNVIAAVFVLIWIISGVFSIRLIKASRTNREKHK